MDKQSKHNKSLQSFCNPTDISILTAFLLFSVSIVPFGFMIASYVHTINDNQLINDQSMSQMLHDSNSFMKKISDDVYDHKILQEYKWLKIFHDLIHQYCHTENVKVNYSQFMACCMAWYNFFLIHLLFVGTGRFSFLAFVPILITFCSIFIDSQKLLVFAFFDFSQMLLSIVMITTFIYMREKKIRSSLVLEQHSKKVS